MVELWWRGKLWVGGRERWLVDGIETVNCLVRMFDGWWVMWMGCWRAVSLVDCLVGC